VYLTLTKVEGDTIKRFHAWKALGNILDLENYIS
jgi:hypothetical protein